MKTCPACKKEQPYSGFFKDSRTKDGLNSWCKNCRKIYEKNNLEASRIRQKRYRMKNPDKVHAVERNARIKRTYGITSVEYEDLVDSQEGLCTICGDKPDRLVIDHDHKTGLIRGLLCHNCNTGIGKLKDNPEIMLRAIAYLSPEFLTGGKSLEGFDITTLNNDLRQLNG